MLKKNYGIWIGLLIFLIFIFFLWNDMNQIRTYYKEFNKNEYQIVSLENSYINAKKIFSFIQKENDFQKIKEYMEKKHTKTYLLNSSHQMMSKGKHKVGLEDPKEKRIYQIIELENHALYMNYNEKEEVLITVVSEDINKSKDIFNQIKIISVKKGKEKLKNEDISVLWYDGNQIESMDKLHIIR